MQKKISENKTFYNLKTIIQSPFFTTLSLEVALSADFTFLPFFPFFGGVGGFGGGGTIPEILK